MRCWGAAGHQICDVPTSGNTAGFELRTWSCFGTRKWQTFGNEFEGWMCGKAVGSPVGVLLPVGCEVQEATVNDLSSQEIKMFGRDDATFVMTCLRPWIGKVDTHTDE